MPINKGEDFECWKAVSASTSQKREQKKLLLLSSVSNKGEWQTILYTFRLLDQETLLEEAISGKLNYVQVSPDGRYVLFKREGESSLFVYDRISKSVQKIPMVINIDNSSEYWTSDSQCVLIESEEKVWAYKAIDNTMQEKVIEEKFVPEGKVIWGSKKSPNGRYTASLCMDLNRVCLINSSGQKILHAALEWPKLEGNVSSMVSLYGWSPDSQILLFGFSSPGEPKGYIHMLRLVFFDDNGVHDYKDVGKWIIHGASWSPDGKRILISTEKFLILEVSTGTITSINPLEDFRSSWNVKWMMDSDSIVYISQDGRSLYRVKIDGAHLEKLPIKIDFDIQDVFPLP